MKKSRRPKRAAQTPPAAPTPDEIQVRLKPLLGIPPTIYVPVVWTLLIVFVLFVLLLLPGILNPGAYLTVITAPARASVYLDDGFAGTSPCTVFLPDGVHTLRVRKAGWDTAVESVEIRGRRFATLFFPHHVEIRTPLSLEEPAVPVNQVLASLSSWSLTTPPISTYALPPLLTWLADDARTTPAPDHRERLTEAAAHALAHAVPFLSHTDQAVDLARAILVLSEARTGPTPSAPLAALRMALSLLQEHPGLLSVLPALLPSAPADAYQENAFYHTHVERRLSSLSPYRITTPAPAPDTLGHGPFVFRALPGGELYPSSREEDLDGGKARVLSPRPWRIAPFYILDREVTKGMYALFLQAHPEWSPQAKAALVEQGLVDGTYLYDYATLEEDAPLPYVSWYAAQAFCRWLEDYLPPSITAHYEVRLPAEQEWEWAVRLSGLAEISQSSRPRPPEPFAGAAKDKRGIASLLGNLWEWTAGPYYSLYALAPPVDEVLSWHTIEAGVDEPASRTVRGGSILQARLAPPMRGVLHPSWTSPVVGFRPILIRRHDG
ncbi:SUMF1/EgtB/PvdO family nonheme iron enzyme [Spirochaeta thermophila]|uniref:PEGA domain-containing protein n=1 Tax=Winmispira thermophila (strain ATCC 49972 / DSM 6192 / RI 19.B1) TaxID=665571 RepID=E0RSU5_WINT6|nr:SUMF1/EgtB/PvdO family nonheme iron enzyme [Spirochaeta thermophila]ADN02082.1 hypothetical protein STHERM_c11370 [Spirochaeta thermophila DSM 6192]